MFCGTPRGACAECREQAVFNGSDIFPCETEFEQHRRKQSVGDRREAELLRVVQEGSFLSFFISLTSVVCVVVDRCPFRVSALGSRRLTGTQASKDTLAALPSATTVPPPLSFY